MSAEEHGKKPAFLFEEFEAATKNRWLELVHEDLKGGDFDRKLVWKSDEGFSVQPMYFREDMEKLAHLNSLPGFAPHLRGSNVYGAPGRPWSISQTHTATGVETLLDEVRAGVSGGQHRAGIRFHALLRSAAELPHIEDMPEGGAWITSAEDFGALCDGLPEMEGIDLYAGLSSPALLAAARGRNFDLHADYDPVALLVETAALPWSTNTVFRLMADAIRFAAENIQGATVTGISGEPWHNAGGSAVEEVACVLATGVEYLHQLQERGVDVPTSARHMRFTFPVGNTFFMEVAKLRAARALWTRVLEEFAPGEKSLPPMRVHVTGSQWSKTVYDPYVNMLRSTVQAMAGAIGGAESMDTPPFDDVAGQPGVFSRRIARNVQIILQEESRLGHVHDPAGGSYYVEQLTDSIMRHAWDLFREIEAHGGVIAALKDGFIQARITKTAEKKKDGISRRRDVIVGTNQYPNLSEKPLQAAGTRPVPNAELREHHRAAMRTRGDAAKAHAAFSAALADSDANLVAAMHEALAQGMTLPELHDAMRAADRDPVTVTPLRAFRASEDFEKLRRAVESSDSKPRVFLATYGAVNWSRARATFSSGFFGAAGMEIIDNLGFPSAAAAAHAAVESGADIVVACSEDDQYRETIPEIMDILRASGRRVMLIVAGNPADDVPALREAGVHAFIHVKADVGALLADMLRALGIEIQ